MMNDAATMVDQMMLALMWLMPRGHGIVEISKGIIPGILCWSVTTTVLQLKDFY